MLVSINGNITAQLVPSSARERGHEKKVSHGNRSLTIDVRQARGAYISARDLHKRRSKILTKEKMTSQHSVSNSSNPCKGKRT